MLPLVFVVLIAATVIGIRLARRAVLIRRQRQSVLPVSYHPLSKRSRPNWGWTVERTSASVWTRTFNKWPRLVVVRLGNRSKVVFVSVYDLGAALGILGTLLGALGLLLATSDVWFSIISVYFDLTEALDTDGGKQSPPVRPFLEPIIPGFTRPLSHLPILSLALLVNQGIHEVGHALSAAFDGVASSSVSIGFTGFVLPMASVSFDMDDLDELARAPSMRLAAAGPLHNFATWIVMMLAVSLGAQSLYLEDVSARGLYVQQYRPGSELSSYLPDFAVFTHIDLTPLSGPAALSDWNEVLTQSSSLTRLTWQDLDNETANGVITWEGSRGVLLEDITVSKYAPRLPRQMSSIVRLYFEYFIGMALSLALFNLLPFPHSDGSKLLTAAIAAEHEDLESGKMRMHLGRRLSWIKTLEWTVAGIGAAFGIGQVVLHFVA